MSSDRIVVVLGVDHAFAKQLAAVLAGLARFATREHEVFVVHDGYDLDLRARVCAGTGAAVTVEWVQASAEPLQGAQLPAYLSPATLFRLQLANVVPAEVERLVYLDLDTAIRAPLDELWETDLNGCAVAAVRDPSVPWAAAPRGLSWTELGIPPDTPYFNAGALVVDVPAWRAQRVAESAFELLARHAFLYADQCALNTVIAGAWAPLSPRWNLQAAHLAGDGSLAWITEDPEDLARAIEDPAIVHYNTSRFGRPWEADCTHPRRDLWFEQLDRTEWAAWRPEPPIVPSRARRAVGRVRRAGNVLLGR